MHNTPQKWKLCEESFPKDIHKSVLKCETNEFIHPSLKKKNKWIYTFQPQKEEFSPLYNHTQPNLQSGFRKQWMKHASQKLEAGNTQLQGTNNTLKAVQKEAKSWWKEQVKPSLKTDGQAQNDTLHACEQNDSHVHIFSIASNLNYNWQVQQSVLNKLLYLPNIEEAINAMQLIALQMPN